MNPNSQSRRSFLQASLGAFVGISFLQSPNAQAAMLKKGKLIPFGVCTSYNNALLLKKLGYEFIEESVSNFLLPEDSKGGDAQYEKNKALVLESKVPIRSYTGFFPGTLKSVGEELHHEAILARTEEALKRAKACGSKNIVFGSGGSRRIPDGFDREKAKQQHIELSKKMAPLAEKYKVTISIEPLNSTETNFVNSLREGAEIVTAVNNPWFQLLCDIYHMKKDNEGPEEIIKFGDMIKHCHIAERENRTPAGVDGDDFTPYFKALKKIKYTGGMALECRWKDFEAEVTKALPILQQQWLNA